MTSGVEDLRTANYPPPPGETLTRRAVTVITGLIAVMAFLFSLGNITALCLYLGITPWIAWMVGPTVDLSVVGLLVGIRYLSLRGWRDDELRKPRRLLAFSGVVTLALNTSYSLAHRHFGTALVDAVGPALLIGWAETGPWLLRQIYAARAEGGPGFAEGPDAEPVPEPNPDPEPASEPQPKGPAPSKPSPVRVPSQRPPSDRPADFPADLLTTARRLDAMHRAATGRPISRDTLRAELRIARDRASALITQVRAEASKPGTDPDRDVAAVDASAA